MDNQVINFGCRLNIFEGEAIKQALTQAGAPIDDQQKMVILNSCAVTAEAERQLRQSIRKIRREQPEAKIIVTGCAAQINPDFYANMQEVDHVLGNIEKLSTDNYSDIINQPAPIDPLNPLSILPKAKVNDIMEVKETAAHLISSFDGKTRAFLEIQNGCNHRCTFCIIPYGRGNNRSVPLGEIVNRVRELVSAGYKEVVLTGVDISGYGEDLPGTPNLTNAVSRILNLVPELPRLRLSSVDVAELGDDFLELFAKENRLMPHLHLSIQAGDNMILKRMKRRHLREDVLSFCNKAKQARPEVVFGADFITGFPTETEEMFANSLDLVERIGINYLHVFPYSVREGTPAAKMPQVMVKDRKERAKRLRQLGEKNLGTFLENKIGKEEIILMESNDIGRTIDFAEVRLFSKDHNYKAGDILKVKINSIEDAKLIGQIIGA